MSLPLTIVVVVVSIFSFLIGLWFAKKIFGEKKLRFEEEFEKIFSEWLEKRDIELE